MSAGGVCEPRREVRERAGGPGADRLASPGVEANTDDRGRAEGRGVRMSWGGTLWLLFLYFFVSEYVAAGPHPVWHAALVTVLLVAFAAVVVYGTVHKPRYFRTGDARAGALDAAWPVVAIAVLGVVLSALTDWMGLPGLMIYTATISAFRLPYRVAPIGLLGPLVVVGLVHLALRPPLSEIGFFYLLIPLSWWSITSMRRVIESSIALATAREQVATLDATAERERVARDVHDILGHSLTVVTVKAQLAGRLLEPGAEDVARARAEIADVEALAREALADVRSTVGGLRVPILADEIAGCQAALRAADIDAVVRGSATDVPPERRELFAWVLREAVTNVVRHSGASRCRVTLRADSVEVVDDGRGLGDGERDGHVGGLHGLRERVTAAGGALRLSSRDGTRLEVGMP